MLLGVIPMICFEFLRILEKNRKKKKRKTRKFGQTRAPMPQCGLPRHGEAEGPKRPPSGTLWRSLTSLRRSLATPQRSSATWRRRHCSLRENFRIFVSEHLVFVYR